MRDEFKTGEDATYTLSKGRQDLSALTALNKKSGSGLESMIVEIGHREPHGSEMIVFFFREACCSAHHSFISGS